MVVGWVKSRHWKGFYRGTTRPGIHTKSYGKWSFIVDLPIKNGGFSWLCLFTRGYMAMTDYGSKRYPCEPQNSWSILMFGSQDEGFPGTPENGAWRHAPLKCISLVSESETDATWETFEFQLTSTFFETDVDLWWSTIPPNDCFGQGTSFLYVSIFKKALCTFICLASQWQLATCLVVSNSVQKSHPSGDGPLMDTANEDTLFMWGYSSREAMHMVMKPDKIRTWKYGWSNTISPWKPKWNLAYVELKQLLTSAYYANCRDVAF